MKKKSKEPDHEKLNCKVSFRCTPAEKKFISEKAAAFPSESEFIRIMVFEKSRSKFFDGEIIQLIRKIEWDNVKIGTNINQVVKSCNSKKFVSEKDLDELVKYQTLLNYKFDKLLTELRNRQEGGVWQ